MPELLVGEAHLLGAVRNSGLGSSEAWIRHEVITGHTGWLMVLVVGLLDWGPCKRHDRSGLGQLLASPWALGGD
jgi:hypothetical protein